MQNLFLVFWLLMSTAGGCITPDTQNSRGTQSPMLNAFQAAQTQSASPMTFPLSPQAQAYALVGGVLVIMVLVILKSSQWKD